MARHQARDPLVLVLINWFIKIIRWVWNLWLQLASSLPVFWISTFYSFIKVDNTPFGFFRFLCIPVYWLSSVMIFPTMWVFCLYMSRVLLSFAEEDTSQVEMIIAKGFVYIFIFVSMWVGYRLYGNPRHELQYLRSMWELQSLLASFLLFWVAVAGVFRARSVFRYCLGSTTDLKNNVGWEVLWTFTDWLLVPSEIIIHVLDWRKLPMLRLALAPMSYSDRWWFTFWGSISVLVDLVFFAFAVPVLLTGYRFPRLRWRFKGYNDWESSRQVCVQECFGIFVDLLYVALSVLSLHRYPQMLLHVYRKNSIKTRRDVVRDMVYLAWRDIECLFLILLLAVPTVVRLPQILAKIGSADAHDFIERECANILSKDFPCLLRFIPVALTLYRLRFLRLSDFHATVEANFGLLLTDLFYLPFFLLNHAFFWRLPHFYRTFMGLTKAEDCYIFIGRSTREGFTDVPYIFLGILTHICFWRIPALYSSVYSATTAERRRFLLQDTFHSALLDFPFGVMFVYCLLFFWRWDQLFCARFLQGDARARHQVIGTVFLEGCNDYPYFYVFALCLLFPWRWYGLYENLRVAGFLLTRAPTRRNTVWKTFVSGCTDVPYIALFIIDHMFFWHFYWLWEGVGNANSAEERYEVVSRTFFTGMADIPHFIMFVLTNVLFCWRAPAVWRGVWAADSAIARHKVAAEHFSEGIMDTPSVIAFLLTMVTFWRAKKTITEIYAQPLVPMRRWLAVENLILALVDIPCAFFVVFLLATQWRWYMFREDLAQDPSKWHKVAARQVLTLMNPLELLCIFAAPLSLWRFPYLKRCLENPQRIHHDQDRRMAAYTYFALAICDVALLFAMVILLGTLWRARSLLEKVRAHFRDTRAFLAAVDERQGQDYRALRLEFLFHKVVFTEFLLLLRDTPYLIMFALSHVCFWRIRGMYASLNGVENFQTRLQIVCNEFLSGLLDLPRVVLETILRCTWKKGSIPTNDSFLDLVVVFLDFLLDCVFIAVSPALLWRLPAILGRLFAGRVVAEDSVITDAAVNVFLNPEQEMTGRGELDGHGVVFAIKGRKPPGFTVRQISMHLDNELFAFLAEKQIAPQAILSMFRMTMYPVALCDSFLPASHIVEGSDVCDVEIHCATGKFGKIKVSHGAMKGPLRKFASLGNPKIRISLEFANGGLVSNRCRGKFLEFAFTARQLLDSEANGPQPAEVLHNPLQVEPVTSSAIRMAMLTQFVFVILDVLCLGVLGCLLVVPWRWKETLSVLFADSLHSGTAAHAKNVLTSLPNELFMLFFALITPWNLKAALSILIFAPDDVCKQKRTNLIDTCKLDLVDMFQLLFLILTLWRLPSLIYDCMYLYVYDRELDYWIFEAQISANTTKRVRLSFIMAKQIYSLALDVIQTLQIVYILGTIVGIRSFVGRLYRWARHAMSQERTVLNQLLADLRVKPVDPEENWGLCEVLPDDTVHHNLFPFLDYKELCAVQGVCRHWAPRAKTPSLWRKLYVERFGEPPVTMPLTSDWKALYETRQRQIRRRPATQWERDYKLGLRTLINEEFWASLGNILHFFLLPLKFMGYAMAPLVLFLYLRYGLVENLLSSNRALARIFVEDASQRRELRQLYRTFTDFWKVHNIPCEVFYMFHVYVVMEISSVIACFNLLLACCLTFAGPIWMAVPNVNILRDAFVGLVFPFFLVVQWHLLTGPLYSYFAFSLSAPSLLQPLASYDVAKWLTLPNIHPGDTINFIWFLPITRVDVALVQNPVRIVSELFFSVLSTEVLLLNRLGTMTFPAFQWVVSVVTHYSVFTVPWKVFVFVMWVGTFFKSLYRSFKLLDHFFPPGIRPFWLYTLPFRLIRQFLNLVWDIIVAILEMYEAILAFFTRICAAGGLLGDILLIPVAFIWMGWPALVVYLWSFARVSYIPSGIFVLYLLVRGQSVIRENWNQ